jgi:hypothetical protein
MKITGYAIREALRRWQLRRDTAESQFTGTLLKFEDETKSSPEEIIRLTLEAETAIARLQILQTRYNLAVTISVDGIGSHVTLLECIKRFGGLGRVEKLWRKASTEKGDRYEFVDRSVRDKDQIVAKRAISYEVAAKHTIEAGRFLGKLREAVAVGNAREMEFENLDAALFE